MKRIFAILCLTAVFDLRPVLAQAFGVKVGSTFGALRPYLIEDLYAKHNVYRQIPDSLPLNWSIFPPEANLHLNSYEVKFSRLGVVGEIKGSAILRKETAVEVTRGLHIDLLTKYHRYREPREDKWPAFEKAFASGIPKDGAYLYESWDKFSRSSQLPTGFLSVSISLIDSESGKGTYELSIVYRFDEPASSDARNRGL